MMQELCSVRLHFLLALFFSNFMAGFSDVADKGQFLKFLSREEAENTKSLGSAEIDLDAGQGAGFGAGSANGLAYMDFSDDETISIEESQLNSTIADFKKNLIGSGAGADLSEDKGKAGVGDSLERKSEGKKKEKALICAKCLKKFTYADMLVKHEQKHFAEIALELVKENSVQALKVIIQSKNNPEILNYALNFAKKKNCLAIVKLLEHENGIKKGKNLFLCTHADCEAFFTNNTLFKNHLKKHKSLHFKYKRKQKGNAKKRKGSNDSSLEHLRAKKKARLDNEKNLFESATIDELIKSTDANLLKVVIAKFGHEQIQEFIKQNFHTMTALQLHHLFDAGLTLDNYLIRLSVEQNASLKMDLILGRFITGDVSFDQKLNYLNELAQYCVQLKADILFKIIQNKIEELKNSISKRF